MISQISVITLATNNFVRARKFYEKGLCWKSVKTKQSKMVYYSTGSILLALYDQVALAEEIGIVENNYRSNGILISINVKSHNEVDTLLENARSAGGLTPKPAEEKTWGCYSGFFNDPDGHTFEAIWNPKWDFDRGGFMTD